MILNDSFTDLEALKIALINNSNYDSSLEYDIWNVVMGLNGLPGHRLDEQGHIAKCIVLKKNNLNAIAVYLKKNNEVHVKHIIPNAFLQGILGKSNEQRQNILEIITGKLKAMILADKQEKAFIELVDYVKTVKA